jgi:autotransporter-associated beta strand protein
MRTHLLATTAAAALLAATSVQASRIFQEQPCRRPNGSRPFGLPLPKRPRLRATAVLASAALNLAARIAIPVIVLNGVSGVASAQNAVWNGPGADWNTPANWALTVPGPNGTATFTGNVPKEISMAGVVDVGALQFNAPNYIFNVLGATRINGTGVDASLANAPTFSVISGAGGNSGFAIDFNNSSSAGTARFILGQVVDTNNGFNAGFINFQNSSTAGQATITVRDASATNFNNSSTAGQATLIVENGGFVGFNDQSSGAQATVINNAGGEVGIFGLSTAGTSLGSIAGAGTFTLGSKELTVGSNNNSTEVGGIITGDGGSLVKVGTGLLTLSGVNTYTGTTTVNAGALIVNGSIASSSLTTVNSGAALIGSGTVGSTVVNSGGFLVPGPVGTPGAMTIAGNLALQSGAFYIVQVNPGAAATTNVSGAATLAGTVGAIFLPGSYITRSDTILSAAGGRTGTFDALRTAGLPAGLAASLSFTGNTAVLNLTAQLVPGPTPPSPGPTAPSPGGPVRATPGLPVPPIPGLPPPPTDPTTAQTTTQPLPPFTVNQLNVGRAIDNFFNNGGALPPAFVSLYGLTGSNLTNALDQLSGEPATGAQKVAFQLTNQFLDLMLDPFVDGRCGIARTDQPPLGYPDECEPRRSALGFAPEREGTPPAIASAYASVLKEPRAPLAPVYEPRWTAWAGAYGGSNRTTGDLAIIGSHDLSARTVGGAAGLDYHLTPDTVVGFALGGGGTNWSLSQGLGGGKSDAFQAGLYGATRWGPAYLAADFAFTNHWMSTDRLAVFDHLSADLNAQSYGGRLEGGYRFGLLYGGITPYAAIQAQSFHTPGYTETDAIANGFGLAFGSRDASDTRSELGTRFDRVLAVYSNAVLALRGKVAWAHDWVSDATLMPAFQSLPGASFIVNGATLPKNSALTSAGAELRVANGVTLLAKFDGDFASHSTTYAGTGTLRYRW